MRSLRDIVEPVGASSAVGEGAAEASADPPDRFSVAPAWASCAAATWATSVDTTQHANVALTQFRFMPWFPLRESASYLTGVSDASGVAAAHTISGAGSRVGALPELPLPGSV